MMLYRNFDKEGRMNIGRQLLKQSLLPVLNTGRIRDFLKLSGNIPLLTLSLQMCVGGSNNSFVVLNKRCCDTIPANCTISTSSSLGSSKTKELIIFEQSEKQCQRVVLEFLNLMFLARSLPILAKYKLTLLTASFEKFVWVRRALVDSMVLVVCVCSFMILFLQFFTVMTCFLNFKFLKIHFHTF